MEPTDPPTTPLPRIHLEASGTGDIHQAGRDQHFYYRDGVWVRRRTIAGGSFGECPYPGLAAFGPEQAHWFFGRDGLLAELVDRLNQRLLRGGVQVVLAPSGAGKSSLLRAGLLPALDCDRVPGANRWPRLVLTPTSDPLWVLAANLAALTGGDVVKTVEELATDPRQCVPMLARALRPDARLVVVVDQFEELFTLCADDRQRRVFVDLLVHLADAGALVVIGVRADFYPACADRPRLRAALQDAPLVVGPMSESELRQAILHPAEAVGLDIEPGLIELLLRDLGATRNAGADREAGYEAGRLPLLAHALRVCWQQRNGSTLTVQGYQDAGGIQHAIATTADRVYDSLDDTGRHVARALFLRLIRIGDGIEDVRRSVSRTGLLAASADPAVTSAVLAVFTQARLLTQREDTVEVTHEALLTSWPRLRGWIGADRDWLRAHQQIADDTESWRRAGRDVSLLYGGTRLAVARQWLPAHASDMNEAERDYLDRAYAHQRTQARRRQALRSGLVLVIVVALVLSALYWYTQRQRDEAQVRADSRALAQASQDSATSDPALSIMTAMAAYQTSATQEARNQLLREYLKYSHATRVLSGLTGKLAVSHPSADGEVVFSSTDTGRPMLFVHAATGVVAEPVTAEHVVYTMVTPDGKRAGFVDDFGAPGWFDVDSGSAQPVGPVRRLPRVPGFKVYGSGPQDAAAMSADGKLLALTMGERLVWWDLETETMAGSMPAPPDAVNGIWIGADNRTLLVKTDLLLGGNGLVAVDMATGGQRTVVEPVERQRFLMSGDRTAVVVCTPQGDGGSAVRLLRVSDGAAMGPVHSSGSTCGLVAADKTGQRVLMDEDTYNLVDLVRGSKIATGLQLPENVVRVAELISMGETLVLAGLGTAQITYTELPLGPRTLSVVTQVLTHDGEKTISLLKDGSLQLRPVGGGDRLLAESPGPRQAWDPADNVIRLTRDGLLVANREAANVVVVRETESLREVARVTTMPSTAPRPGLLGDYLLTGRKPPDVNFSYFFDWTGNLVTVADSQVQQWDSRTGRQLAHWDSHTALPTDLVAPLTVGPYPAANQLAVIMDRDPVVRIVDVTTGRTTTTVQTVPDVLAVNFDSSGRYFALLRKGAVVELWRRDPPRRELGPLRSLTGITSSPWYAAFVDGEGHYLIAANNSIHVYQVGVQAPVDTYEFGHPNGSTQDNPYSFINAAKDGKTVLYADEKGIGGPLKLDPAKWVRELCGVIGHRDFTPDERAALPAPVSLRPVCVDTN
ncbi:hypothetical protein AB5J62_08105 [Amycolatopsis sp. cg5]|uniref:nSTAND1 domain-containing NTPase n=1 Tax=Amycolatopsis sp. cg5 TaxID=3238802 RepID=UPI00352619AE